MFKYIFIDQIRIIPYLSQQSGYYSSQNHSCNSNFFHKKHRHYNIEDLHDQWTILSLYEQTIGRSEMADCTHHPG